MTGNGLVLGTRGSALALWQAREVARQLRAAHPGLEVREQIIVTTGDRGQSAPNATLVEGKGAWVAEIEAALRAGTIDLAVHSLKDVPSELAEGLALVAIPPRADPRDALVSRSGAGIDGLASGSRVGTSSLRRVCQLRAARRDLQIEILRGNVDTRLRKVSEGVVDAAVLACAGLDRLGFSARIAERISVARMLPAIGQGALAIEARRDDARVAVLCRGLADAGAEVTVAAERALLAALGVGCRTPVAGHATLEGDRLTISGLVGRPDATEILTETVTGSAAAAALLGSELGRRLLAAGAGRILAELESLPV
ncbi:MAG TPA: hydroxymethylbilane synthase [Polyangia bacterium]|nr:hydroxymethylbilane synthase [Polyangia bacterium]